MTAVQPRRRFTRLDRIITFIFLALALVFLALIILLPPKIAKADSLGVLLDSQSYFVNLEYSGKATQYREGETFFGQYLTLAPYYKLSDSLRFAAGVFLGKKFGTETEPDWVQFWGQFQYQPNEHFALTFGNLSRERHDLMDALYDLTLKYQRPTETGFELYGAYNWVSSAAWINWQSLNTSEHREKYDVGWWVKAEYGWLGADFQMHWIHHGGQQYSANQPVTDDFAIAVGPTLTIPVPFLDKAGVSAHYLHSSFSQSSSFGPGRKGDGAKFKAFVEKWGGQLWASYWTGNNFWTADGDPFYQADTNFKFGVNKTWKITDWCKIGVGLDGLILDGSVYFNETFFVTLTPRFEREIQSPWKVK